MAATPPDRSIAMAASKAYLTQAGGRVASDPNPAARPAARGALDAMTRTMRVMQLCDSASPIGTFAFSAGLETAVAAGAVSDATSLESFVQTALAQATRCEAVIALIAHRAARRGDFATVGDADRHLVASKASAESRAMLLRMGRKLSELCVRLFPDPLTLRWAADISAGRTPGTHPVALAVAFAAARLPEETLFCAHRYGVVSMLTGAALRCLRVTHYDTQRILARSAVEAAAAYREVATFGLDDVQSFAPQMDLWAAWHEQGASRLFMS